MAISHHSNNSQNIYNFLFSLNVQISRGVVTTYWTKNVLPASPPRIPSLLLHLPVLPRRCSVPPLSFLTTPSATFIHPHPPIQSSITLPAAWLFLPVWGRPQINTHRSFMRTDPPLLFHNKKADGRRVEGEAAKRRSTSTPLQHALPSSPYHGLVTMVICWWCLNRREQRKSRREEAGVEPGGWKKRHAWRRRGGGEEVWWDRFSGQPAVQYHWIIAPFFPLWDEISFSQRRSVCWALCACTCV